MPRKCIEFKLRVHSVQQQWNEKKRKHEKNRKMQTKTVCND